jgi:TPR repeat protein
MPAGINDAQLRQLAEITLDELDPGAAFTDDSYADALAWACGLDPASDARWRGIALVRPVPGSKETRWRDFDAVTTWATTGPDPDPPLSQRTWAAVIAHVTPDTALSVGLSAYAAREFAVSTTAHRIGAEAGDADAMDNLAGLLAYMLDPPQFDEARTWWERAAEAGVAGAMFNLGALFVDDVDPPQFDEARTWWERAAEAGDTHAMINLGDLLANEVDPPQFDEARTWWERAAEGGDTHAMYHLGVLLACKLDPPQFEEARTWWERAGEAGHTHAMYNLGVLLTYDVDPPQFDEARTWWERAANAGGTGAMYNLGVLLEQQGDLDEAEKWFDEVHRCTFVDPQ